MCLIVNLNICKIIMWKNVSNIFIYDKGPAIIALEDVAL